MGIVRHRPPAEAEVTARAEPARVQDHGQSRPAWLAQGGDLAGEVVIEVAEDGDHEPPRGRHRVGSVQHLRKLLELARVGDRQDLEGMVQLDPVAARPSSAVSSVTRCTA